MAEILRYARFAPLLGESFRLESGPDAALELALIEVKRLGSEAVGEAEDAAEDGQRRPFSLLFRGPATPRLEQGTFRLEHAALGALDVFLVPMEPDAEGPRYEAVFT